MLRGKGQLDRILAGRLVNSDDCVQNGGTCSTGGSNANVWCQEVRLCSAEQEREITVTCEQIVRGSKVNATGGYNHVHDRMQGMWLRWRRFYIPTTNRRLGSLPVRHVQQEPPSQKRKATTTPPIVTTRLGSVQQYDADVAKCPECGHVVLIEYTITDLEIEASET